MLFSLKQIPIPEIVRYALGTALPSPIPQEFLSLAQNAAQEVLSCCQPKYHLVRYPVQPLLDCFLTGEDIRRHLSGCSDCVLLCATLGSEVDALIRRTQVTDMAKTLWLDAAASAAIEQVCDEVQLDIAQRLERSLTTRFSCGYGDLPLSTQPHFLSCLDAGRKIGLHLSPSGMLVPIATIVNPMINCGIPSFFAILAAPSTNQSAPFTRNKKPASKIITCKNIISTSLSFITYSQNPI